MSQITKIGILGVLFLMGLMVIVGCGSSSSNSNSVFDADTKAHPAGWLPAGHMTAAQANIATCEECHGQDLSGGISKVSCTTCHLGGPTSIHPSDWAGDAILTKHGPYEVANGPTACRNQFCHGYDLKGLADSGPSCSQCHSFP